MAFPDECAAKKCKPRFKGIENFFRRVAFNLGNSPSQTEVKIISCIPIDVTDLQQKIIQLEKQLEEVKSARRSSAGRGSSATTAAPARLSSKPNVRPVVNAAKVTGAYAAHTDRAVDNCSIEQPYRYLVHTNSAIAFAAPANQALRDQDRINEVPRRLLFKKNRKPKRPSPLVYYAQTVTSPFDTYTRKESAIKEKQKAEPVVDLSYYTDIIHKLQPEMYLDELMGGSQSSVPVCRDGAAAAPAREPDTCSCCHGFFHDVDLDPEHRPYRFSDTSAAPNPNRLQIDYGNAFYNSNLYDMIPVKEKPEINKKEMEKSMKHAPKFQYEAKCCQEHRSKPSYNPVMVNYSFTPQSQRYAKHKAVKSPKRRERRNKGILCRNDLSRNTSFECGEVYAKPFVTKMYSPPHTSKPHVVKRSVECFTSSVNDTECQTESAKDIQQSSNTMAAENRTESTLNQIKSILQSVLSHIKTNTLFKNQSDEKGKKEDDALKEAVMAPQCSRLLNSFTYSPFQVDPFIASCSHGMPTLCPMASAQGKDFFPVLPNTHFKCMQNFPVFIQQGHPRQYCTSCSCSRGTGPGGHPKQTSTNTLSRSEDKRSKETENLIKEIYKSMALNMSLPQKRLSRTNYSFFKSSEVSRNQLGEPVVSNVMIYNPKVRPSERSFKGQIQTLMSTATASIATSSTRASQPAYHACAASQPGYHASAASQPGYHASAASQPGYHASAASQPGYHASHAAPRSVHDSTTTTVTHRKTRIAEESEHFSDESESEAASDVTVASAPARKGSPSKEPDKTGIFSKLFGSVFKKKKRKGNKKEASTSAVASDASDSDDYETIYSQKVDPPPRPKHVTYASTPRRSRRSVRMRAEQPRRTKYMDAENRRYWDEQLSFHTTPPPTQAVPRPRSIMRTPPPMRTPTSMRAPPPKRAPARPVTHGITLRTRPAGKRYQTVDTRYASIDPPHPPFRLQAQEPPGRDARPRPPRLSVGLKGSNKKLSWLKRHNLGLHCGEQWKKILLEG